jgi:uncharacterized protein with ACT and thioredoxin-like domain
VNLGRVDSGPVVVEANENVSTVEGHIRRSSVEMLFSPPLSSFSLMSLILMGTLSSKREQVVSKRVVRVMSLNLGSGSIKEQAASFHCHPMTAGVVLLMLMSAVSRRCRG